MNKYKVGDKVYYLLADRLCKSKILYVHFENGEYLYQNWKYGSLIIDYRNTDIDDSKLLELLGVDMLGIDIEGLIELYFEEVDAIKQKVKNAKLF